MDETNEQKGMRARVEDAQAAAQAVVRLKQALDESLVCNGGPAFNLVLMRAADEFASSLSVIPYEVRKKVATQIIYGLNAAENVLHRHGVRVLIEGGREGT